MESTRRRSLLTIPMPEGLHEAVAFGVVGAVNVGVDAAVFNMLLLGPTHAGPVPAKAVATMVAVTSSYVMNRLWTFRHRAQLQVVRQYLLFAGLSGVGLALAEACLALSHYGLGSPARSPTTSRPTSSA